MMHQGDLVFNLKSALPQANSQSTYNLNFNNIGTDTTNNSMLFTLPAGYATPKNFTANIQHNLKAEGYSLTTGNNLPLEANSNFDFGSIQYGSKVLLKLYKDSKLSKEYTMIFTSLPVIELTATSIVDDPKKPGTFRLFDEEFNKGAGSLNMGIEFRGSTSQLYPKKSLSIELVKADDPKDELKTKLLNLRKDGEWMLDASYRDSSFVRNLVSYDIYRSMRPFAYKDATGKAKGQPTLAGQLVEVILNGAYHGVFVLGEKVDRKLLDLKKIKPPTDANGDKLWKQVDFSLPENNSLLYKAGGDNNNATLYNAGSVKQDFEQKYPKLKKVAHWQPLEELINFIVTASDQDFISGINNRIDIDSVVDYWILTLVTGITDTLKKNYFFARNESDKFFILPWDYDSTFGMAWHGSKDSTSFRWWDTDRNNLIRRLSALPATGFNSKVKLRWNELRNTVLKIESLTTRFNTYSHQLHSGVATDTPFKRNLTRWPHSGAQGEVPFTETNQNHDHNHQLELGKPTYINKWIADRLNFLDIKIRAQK